MEDLLTGLPSCGTCDAPMVSSDEPTSAEQHQPRRAICAGAVKPCGDVMHSPAERSHQVVSDALVGRLFLRRLRAAPDEAAVVVALAAVVNGRGGLSLVARPAVWEGADPALRRRLLPGVLNKLSIPHGRGRGRARQPGRSKTSPAPADGQTQQRPVGLSG